MAFSPPSTNLHQTLITENTLNSPTLSSCSIAKPTWQKLENIEEDGPKKWVSSNLSNSAQPETPTESMEFLARSWSVSALELSKALCNNNNNNNGCFSSYNVGKPLFSQLGGVPDDVSSTASKDSDIFLPNQSLNPDFFSTQQAQKTSLYKNTTKGRTMGRKLKDQKEKKKHEIRTHNAQIHAAVSVAGVAAAVAAIAASNAMTIEMAGNEEGTPARSTAAIASASALVASHCIEIAEDMGADHNQILTAVNSAVSAKTNGDIMALTAGAATALRGAATLRARLQKAYGAPTITMADENNQGKEPDILTSLNFVSRGGEILKRTRKGALHWKQLSFNIDSNWQVVAKLKSKHMGGAFTKKKKFVVLGVCSEIPAWPEREKEETTSLQKAYFGIETSERIIEFECENRAQKLFWVSGINHLLNSHGNNSNFMK